MKYCVSYRPWYAVLLPVVLIFFNLVFSLQASSQDKRAVKGEAATCMITVGAPLSATGVQPVKPAKPGKNYTPLANQLGYFDRITGIQPLQKVSVQVAYPRAAQGDKAWIIVLDGGSLDNDKKEQLVTLNGQRSIAFNFQAGRDPGIYKIMLRKGNDIKVVQLWVGAEILPVKN